MVWCRFYQYIFIGTHTHKDWREEGETRKAAEREAKSKKKKTVERENEAQGGKPRQGPAVFCLLWVSRTPTTAHGAHNVGTKPGLPGWGAAGKQPRGVAGGDPQVFGPPSPPASILPQPPPPARPATYFWSTPAGRAPAGRAGRRPRPRAWWQRPLARSAFTSTRPCQPPGQAAARLEPTARPAPPSPAPSHRQRRSALSSAGLRRGVEEGTRPPGGGGRDRREGARGTLGSRVGSGDGEQRRESPSPRRGRLPGGRGLGRVGGSGF